MGAFFVDTAAGRFSIDFEPVYGTLAGLTDRERLDAMTAAVDAVVKALETVVYMKRGTSWLTARRERDYTITLELFNDGAVIHRIERDPDSLSPLSSAFVVYRNSVGRALRMPDAGNGPSAVLRLTISSVRENLFHLSGDRHGSKNDKTPSEIVAPLCLTDAVISVANPEGILGGLSAGSPFHTRPFEGLLYGGRTIRPMTEFVELFEQWSSTLTEPSVAAAEPNAWQRGHEAGVVWHRPLQLGPIAGRLAGDSVDPTMRP